MMYGFPNHVQEHEYAQIWNQEEQKPPPLLANHLTRPNPNVIKRNDGFPRFDTSFFENHPQTHLPTYKGDDNQGN